MMENQKNRPQYVIGPVGERLSLETLPPANTVRWVVKRKAEVVAAVAGGLLTADEACDRYGLSLEEVTRWESAIRSRGMRGLRVTRIQDHRGFNKQQRDGVKAIGLVSLRDR
jgi:hypothetical protein